MTVLMLANQDDYEAVLVAQAAQKQGADVQWLDTAWFPTRASVAAELGPAGWRAQITTPHGEIDTDALSAVFYTQSQPFTFPPGLSEPELRYATVEARFGLGGLLASLPVRWVSHPSAIADAEYRVRQMAVAARCGFRMPASLLTNKEPTARVFANEHGPVVFKAIMHKLISEDNAVKLIYTTPVNPADLDDRVEMTAHLFQHNVGAGASAGVGWGKEFDARVVATRSGICLGVRIDAATEQARQDWRTGYGGDLTYRPVEVPAEVAGRCRDCLTRLDLRAGVFDFSVTGDGQWWYLEVNPGGRWAWLQAETGLPLAEAIAAELTDTNLDDSP
jgi:hypothetical protein